MKSKEEIINDITTHKLPPDNYDPIERHCFLSIKNLISLYEHNCYTKEEASRIKQKILVAYEKESKQLEFQKKLFQEHVQHIKETELLRHALHKIPEDKPLEKLALCKKIIAIIFKGEFK